MTNARRRRRVPLLVFVYALSLGLVAITCAVLTAVVSDRVESTALASSLDADESFVNAFVREYLAPTDLTADALKPEADVRRASIEDRLRSLVARSGVLRIKVFGPDGTILYSDVPDLAGQNFGLEDDLVGAFAGNGFAEVSGGDEGEERDEHALPVEHVVGEYLPVHIASSIPVVFEMYRDAGPIIAAGDASRRDTIVITLAAAAVLAVLLYLIFRATQRRLAMQTAQLVDAERRDSTTGLLNHGSVVGELALLLEARRSSLGAVGLAIVDIDNFRLVNEAHGHAAGDEVLRSVGRILATELSNESILGRYGPDEFLVITPPSCAHDLEAAIARLRNALASLSLQFGVSERLPVTVSAGICFAPIHGEAATELLSTATVALREAKASGGDGVRVATEGDTTRIAEQSSFDVLQGLVLAVDTKDRYTKRHSDDVARYALFLSDQIGVAADLRQTIGIAGLLHDVGKIGIPDAILRKPAALTAEEYAIVKQHVALGDLIVRDLPDLGTVRAGIRHHHERWDGTGYLDRLAGTDIPAIGRILAVADAFSAMTTTRPYRKALDTREALTRLGDAAGTQLDAELVTAFITGIETVADPPLPEHSGTTGLVRLHVA